MALGRSSLRGGVDQGLGRATEVLAAVPARFRSTHVVETARMVLQAVPVEQQARPAVADLRSMLAIEAG
ncbi:hypothetical protein BKM31_15935 [[Actinomadura] parvosata subsp. kistnae]|uniref:Uncharacterized protein n=1 Tax=[Actinomadura] parvosata subsp. kistnae TaxID=1909395 RepID=A0A1U9ZXW1_9ACTN|nr:hypothetical protein BKM31_15935 [Nonomuraea sp. ATCC 55076]